jgi:hypothetical protein
MKKSFAIIAFAITGLCITASAQQRSSLKNEVSLVFGLNQPLISNGFNYEINYWTKRFVFDWSHGFGLAFRDDLISSEAKKQNLAFNITHSAGLGIGYRFTHGFNLRLEPKVHVWEVYYDDQFKTREGKLTSYKTYTLGLGAYYRWTPFEKKESALRGLTVAPSARWWPNVGSSLRNNEYRYTNRSTGKAEVHKANNIGVSNSAFFVNVSVGYTFGLKR